jgi:regulation of enolase protein 1 (concanavalin A-like superfamily)
VHTYGPSIVAPVWLRLARNGNVISASYRTDTSSTWTLIASQTFASLAATVEAGLAVTSHVDGAVATATFDNVTVTEGDASPAPPAGFASADIGAVGVAGTTSVSGGTITLEASGADIWGTKDAFRYYYRPWSGDGTITVRVQSVEAVDVWTKAGVMFRESLASNAAHAFLFVSPGKGIALQTRPVNGAVSAQRAQQAGTAPEWLRLTRVGQVMTGYASTDGTAWRRVGSTTFTEMPSTIYVGLPITAHNNATLATAVFTNLTLSASVP